MTKHKLFLTIALLGLIIIGCEKKADEPANLADEEFARFGLSGKSTEEVLLTAAKWHNEYQEAIIASIIQSKVNLLDTATLKLLVDAEAARFFSNKGITLADGKHSLQLAKPFEMKFDYAGSNLSLEAKTQLKKLETVLLKNLAYEDLVKELSILKTDVFKLQSKKEQIVVGLPVYIAEASYGFWRENGSKLFQAMRSNNLTSNNRLREGECKVNLWKVGGADVAGAVGGAIDGALLGPGGALAGGVLVSSVSSLGNLTNQVIDCHVSWWPF